MSSPKAIFNAEFISHHAAETNVCVKAPYLIVFTAHVLNISQDALYCSL